MKKSILISTPYFSAVGGTEIEAVSTAIFYYDLGEFDTVSIFTPNALNVAPFKESIGVRDIIVFSYPKYLASKVASIINTLYRRFDKKIVLCDFLYWKLVKRGYTALFVLGYPKSVYFLPIIKAYSKKVNSCLKITMNYDDIIEEKYHSIYKKFNFLLVFSKKQKQFFETNYNFTAIKNTDISILNERELLTTEIVDFRDFPFVTFGYLGRISQEKNIEDMIALIGFLRDKYYVCKLLIRGEGDATYIASLKKHVSNLKLEPFVIIETTFIPIHLTKTFYETIDVFLITSLHEGGPMTALEAVAAGRMIFSYDVGAMSERFGSFDLIINQSYTELCASVLSFIEFTNEDKNKFAKSLRTYYEANLSNACKQNILLELCRKQ